jgi:two-component system chemotaxis response regulator CheB
MTPRDILVIGASAGGVEALRTLVGGLPADLPASVFIVIHTAPDSPRLLAELLDRVSQLPVTYAASGDSIERGRIYLAPPNFHLLIRDGIVELSRGPKENRSRPAVDPLFRSAARVYGKRVIGVILTGNLDDGARGLLLIKKLGGLAVVQDPKDAVYTGMPRSALEHVKVDHVVPVSNMAELFIQSTRELLEEGVSNMPRQEYEPQAGEPVTGARSEFVCPECGGSMWELKDDGLLHFRCHVGHAFGSKTLLAAESQAVDAALWTALRTLEDYAALHGRLADNARANNHHGSASTFEESAEDARRQADIIRKVLVGT